MARIFTEKSARMAERIAENLWESVQSVAENAVLHDKNDFRQSPVLSSVASTYIVPCFLIFEKRQRTVLHRFP